MRSRIAAALSSTARPIVLGLDEVGPLPGAIGRSLRAQTASPRFCSVAEGEFAVGLEGDFEGRPVLIVTSLDRPEAKFLRLALLADRLREMAADPIVLVAPYLPFRDEASAITFGSLVSLVVDGIVTLGSCLERSPPLRHSFHVACREAVVAPIVGDWIARHVERPLLVARSPSEAIWALRLARLVGAPWLADLDSPGLHDRTPVLFGDVLAPDAGTIRRIAGLRSAGLPAPVGISLHALFGPGDAEGLLESGLARLATSNSIVHPTNAIDVGPALAGAASDLLAPEIDR